MPSLHRLRFLLGILLSCPLLHAEEKGLAVGHPNDSGLKDHPAVLEVVDFENANWSENWDGGKRETVTVISSDPERKFEPLHGKALSITTPKGGHYGASIEFPSRKPKTANPLKFTSATTSDSAMTGIPTAAASSPALAEPTGKAVGAVAPVMASTDGPPVDSSKNRRTTKHPSASTATTPK
ncbi:MAG: hypothetical protein QNL33_05820 [Akkermansiaceae bacterium]|jgi:hypothetical protein